MGEVVSIPRTVDTVEFERPPGLPHTCSDAELLEAVKASLCGATDIELAEMLHVPPVGVKYWVGSKQWTVIKQYVWPQLKGLLHTELCGIRSTVLHKLAERVRDGDPQYNLMGELIGYRPVKSRDLATMLVQSSEVIHNLEVEIGVIRDDKNNISLDNLLVALQHYAKADAPEDITGKSERIN